jgi:hypothetical protein
LKINRPFRQRHAGHRRMIDSSSCSALGPLGRSSRRHRPNFSTVCKKFGNSESARFVNGLSLVEAMAENRPPRRPGHHSARLGEPFPDDRERINRARQAAEALFAPKPGVSEASVSAAPPAASAPRRLSTPAVVQHEARVLPNVPTPAAGEIPASQLARIRSWVKYGMTVPQVAAVYGVSVAEIERVLRKA